MEINLTSKKEFFISQKRRNFLLGITLAVLVLFLVGFFIDVSNYNRVFTLMLFLTTGFNYFTQARKPLIAIENDHLVFPGFPKSKIVKFDELQEVYYAAGDYIFKTNEKEYRVIKSMIDKGQVEEFDALFKEFQSASN